MIDMESKEKSKEFREIISWLEKRNGMYTDATDAELAKFADELNDEIGRLNFDLPEGCTALGYAGSVDGIGVYKTIENIADNSSGKYGFINNVAENIVNDDEFTSRLSSIAAPDSVSLPASSPAISTPGRISINFQGWSLTAGSSLNLASMVSS